MTSSAPSEIIPEHDFKIKPKDKGISPVWLQNQTKIKTNSYDPSNFLLTMVATDLFTEK